MDLFKPEVIWLSVIASTFSFSRLVFIFCCLFTFFKMKENLDSLTFGCNSHVLIDPPFHEESTPFSLAQSK